MYKRCCVNLGVRKIRIREAIGGGTKFLMVLSLVQGEFPLHIFILGGVKEPRLLFGLGNNLEKANFEIFKGISKNCENFLVRGTSERGSTFFIGGLFTSTG